MKKKKGFALMLVVCVSAILIIMLAGLITLTSTRKSDEHIYNRTNSSYYAALSGTERTKDVISKLYTPENVLRNIVLPGGADAKTTFDSATDTYITNVLNKINTTTTPPNFDGKTGTDSMSLINSSLISYYKITSLKIDTSINTKLSVDPTTLLAGSTFKYTIPLTLTSIGYLNNNTNDIASKKITYNITLTLTYTVVSSNNFYLTTTVMNA